MDARTLAEKVVARNWPSDPIALLQAQREFSQTTEGMLLTVAMRETEIEFGFARGLAETPHCATCGNAHTLLIQHAARKAMHKFAAQSRWIKITDDPQTLPKRDDFYLAMVGPDRTILSYDTSDGYPAWVDISGNVYYTLSEDDDEDERARRVSHYAELLPAPPES